MADHDPVLADVDLAADEGTRAALARWQPEGPSDGFADRVVAAHVAAPASRPVARRPAWPLWTAAGVAVALVGAALLWPTTATPVTSLARRISDREEIFLGGRGVAVAETGSILGWRRDGLGAVVTQDAGDVFYRVNLGGPFTVLTPAGEVRVTGTCFRVEVLAMSSWKQGLFGAAVGAVVATATVVTLYEGKVLVVSRGGTATVVAGERATLMSGAAPTIEATRAPAVAVAKIELPGEPAAAITRDELLVRDQAQREQLAVLSARVRQLEATVGGRPGRPPGGLGGDQSWMDPTKDELLSFAKECRVQIDLPTIMRGSPMQIDPETGKAVGIAEADLAGVNQVFVELAADWKRRVRGWYVEATGDAQRADELSPEAMGQELENKAADGEPAALQRRISQERAGLVAVPSAGTELSAFERYFRALADLGNEAERWLAAKVGPEKSHALRAHEGGWPMRMAIAGCDDEGGGGGGGKRPSPR